MKLGLCPGPAQGICPFGMKHGRSPTVSSKITWKFREEREE